MSAKTCRSAPLLVQDLQLLDVKIIFSGHRLLELDTKAGLQPNPAGASWIQSMGNYLIRNVQVPIL